MLYMPSVHKPPSGRHVKQSGPGSLGLVYGSRLGGLAGSALGRLVRLISSLVSLFEACTGQAGSSWGPYPCWHPQLLPGPCTGLGLQGR